MMAGKSDELNANIIRREKYGRQRCEIFRPLASKREEDDRNESRTGRTAPCSFFETLDILSEMIDPTLNTVGIDEIHFIQKPLELVRFVLVLLNRGQDVLLAGLDTDFMGRPFPATSAVMNLDAIEIHRLYAWCTVCGFEARWSQLMGRPPADGSSIHTGYEYEPRCTECFEPRKM